MLGLLLCTWLAISPNGNRLSVAWDRASDILHYDVRLGKVVGREPPAETSLADILTLTTTAPDGTRLTADLIPRQPALAAHVASQICFDGRECILLPNGSTSVRGLAVSPDGKYAFAAHILARYTVHTTQLEQGWINTNAVSIIDLAKKKLHATVLLDDVDDGAANPWAVAVSADSRTLYVTHAGTHELSVIDIPALMERIANCEADPSNQLSFLIGIRERIKLPGKGPRALALHGSAVWVAEYFSRTVTRVVPGTRPKIESFPVGPTEPMTPERRGELLFHDASLCFQHWQSCSSCHPDARVDGLNWDLINDGIGNPKNTLTMVNAHRLPPVMWTGVRPDAEYAVRSGMRNILLMEPREEDAKAIDAYLKSLQPVPGPVADAGAVERGRQLFFSPEVGCFVCHPKPFYTDGQLHDVGTHGRFDFTTDAEGRRTPQTEFKTPSLLEAWRTRPYLHDGRYATIRDAITDGNHDDLRGRTSHLTEPQIRDLVAFVSSL